MTDENFQLECFSKAETGLLSVISWMEGCKKDELIEYLTNSNADKMKFIEMAFEIKANMSNIETMYASLFMLSKTYNKNFTSYMDSDRLTKIMESFNSMKDTVIYLRDNLTEQLTKTFDLKVHTQTSFTDSNLSNETETSQSNIFNNNIFVVISQIETYSKTQFVCDFLDLVCSFCKCLLTTFMLCQTIIQEEQKVLNDVEQLKRIYNQNIKDVWETLKGLFDTFHEEDFKEEIIVAKEFLSDTEKQLPKNFHQWTHQRFQRHVIATIFCTQQRDDSPTEQAILLFPNDPQKEWMAKQVVMTLDSLGLETRKSKSSVKMQFTSMSILALMNKIGFQGEMVTFIKYLNQNYKGDNDFPKPSALSSEKSKENIWSSSTKREDKEKWAKMTPIINRIKANIDRVIATCRQDTSGLQIPITVKPVASLSKMSFL